jgi:hypothetical protein
MIISTTAAVTTGHPGCASTMLKDNDKSNAAKANVVTNTVTGENATSQGNSFGLGNPKVSNK